MIRFKRDDCTTYPSWETIKMKELTHPYKVRNRNCLPLDIYSVNNKVGFLPQSEQFEEAGYLNEVDTSIYMIAPPYHFAYNPARINIGSIGYQNLGKDVQISSLYEVFSTTEKCHDPFIWYWFSTEYFKKMVYKYQEGGVRLYYYYDKLCETPIKLPCLEEQQKIADFLSSVDKVIKESEKEVQSLEELKKGAMQKIFSQEVRFKDANGNEYKTWKEKTLEQLFEYKNGDSFENSIDGNGRYYLISLNSIDRYGNLKKDLKKVNHANWFLQKDDIIMVLSDVGKGDFLGLCDIIPNDEYVLNQRMGLLRKKEEVVVLYIRNYINHNQPFFKRQGQGSAQLNISKGDVLKFVVKLPCLEEQQKIADFLSDFDTAIEEAKKELEYWKQLKKGLLQQMFM